MGDPVINIITFQLNAASTTSAMFTSTSATRIQATISMKAFDPSALLHNWDPLTSQWHEWCLNRRWRCVECTVCRHFSESWNDLKKETCLIPTLFCLRWLENLFSFRPSFLFSLFSFFSFSWLQLWGRPFKLPIKIHIVHEVNITAKKQTVT